MTDTPNNGAIAAGFIYRQTLTNANGPFVGGSAWRGQFRYGAGRTLLYEATTANGGLVVVDANNLQIILPAAVSASWRGSVVVDIVRTDGSTPEYGGFVVTIPVMTPVTAP